MPESFGAMLRRLREATFLSQNQLARRAGVDPAYVNRLEREQPASGATSVAMPRRPVVLALANVLDLTPGRTDRLLHAAGLATDEDWQTRALAAEAIVTTIREALAVAEEPPASLVRRAV